MGMALAGPPSSLFLQKSATSRAGGSTVQQSYLGPDNPKACIPARQQSGSSPATPTRSRPVPVEKSIISINNRFKVYTFDNPIMIRIPMILVMYYIDDHDLMSFIKSNMFYYLNNLSSYQDGTITCRNKSTIELQKKNKVKT